MADLDKPLSKDDFAQAHWEDVIVECTDKDTSCYSSGFLKKAHEAEVAGNDRLYAVFDLLGFITWLVLRPESLDEPFGPHGFVLPGVPFRHISDISAEKLDLLKELVPGIVDPEMCSRIEDILWIRTKDPRMGQAAVSHYITSATQLQDPANWWACVSRIERALALAGQLGQKKKEFAAVISHIETVLDQYKGQDPLFLSAKLMELLQKHKKGDPTKYAQFAENAALSAEAEGVWHRARTYWNIKASWHMQADDLANAQSARIQLAETFVKEANDVLANSQLHVMAAAHIELAILAYRDIDSYRSIPGILERIDELHRRLLSHQEKSPDELVVLAIPLKTHEISERSQRAIAQVKGKSFAQAMIALASFDIVIPRSLLWDNIEQSHSTNLISSRIPKIRATESGKTAARAPGISTGDVQENEKAIRPEALRLAAVLQRFNAEFTISPARLQVNKEHSASASIASIEAVIGQSLFIPPERSLIYAQGLYAGLAGDFLVAAHLLIPQLENSIRYVLNQHGVLTSGFDRRGIQKEFVLDMLLYMEEMQQVFGEDLTFDLQGLLFEKFGSNLRNLMAHGIMSRQSFFSGQVEYLWWLTLRLCCLPLPPPLSHQTESEINPYEITDTNLHNATNDE